MMIGNTGANSFKESRHQDNTSLSIFTRKQTLKDIQRNKDVQSINHSDLFSVLNREGYLKNVLNSTKNLPKRWALRLASYTCKLESIVYS